MLTVEQLSPTELWKHFSELNAVPRPSKKEERVRKMMVNFGHSLGLETIVDKIGNVIIFEFANRIQMTRIIYFSING
jgi:dipeptidase D